MCSSDLQWKRHFPISRDCSLNDLLGDGEMSLPLPLPSSAKLDCRESEPRLEDCRSGETLATSDRLEARMTTFLRRCRSGESGASCEAVTVPDRPGTEGARTASSCKAVTTAMSSLPVHQDAMATMVDRSVSIELRIRDVQAAAILTPSKRSVVRKSSKRWAIPSDSQAAKKLLMFS